MELASRRARTIVLGSLLITQAGCFDNPAWASERILVEGALHGRTCDVRVEGQPIPVGRSARQDSLNLFIDFAWNVGLAPGQGLKTVICRGLQISIASPVGELPAAGTYAVSAAPGYPAGTANVALVSRSITSGRWPLAWGGAYLEARTGEVQLEAMDRESARGTFRVWARRRTSGE
jgi:hypothetical protein